MAVNKLQIIGDIIHILGTNHIAQASKETVHKVIAQIQPDIVMIELDEERLQILLDRERKMVEGKNNLPIQDSPLSGYLEHSSAADNSPELPPFLAAFERIQQTLGGIMGIMPGDELLTAIHVVKDLGTPLHLIDLPIQETVERIAHLQTHFPDEQNTLMQELRLEKLPTDQDEIHNLFHLLEDPEALKALLTEFRAQFPDLTKILVDDRNAYMVSHIKGYHTLHPFKKILVICGALHVTGIVSSLQSQIYSDSTPNK